jgi:hypothetical protein
MAAMDDYIKAGFPYAKAVALTNLQTASWPNAAATAANIDSLVRVGFSVTQAQQIEAEHEGNPTGGAGLLAATGLWAGTEVPMLVADV